ncbi:glycosyltransferase [Cyclobacterium salsum]|uniref:glycosyltransferase n=1 Tax=Cyclobacterium salsum TaxID=2666329 RepID=UPI001391159D|nr:glycosyltransferase [Cyclobacterium salsum]
MKKTKICFTSPMYSVYSETFIQNLKMGIEGEIFHCFGGMFPNQSEDRELVNYLKPELHHRILKRLGFLRKPLDQLYLSDYIKTKKIDLIFANYGPAGARMVPVAKGLGIPLIVHFHGFDASVKEIISNNREPYIELFKTAKSIIVVSETMKQDLVNLGANENKIKKIIYAPNSKFLNISPDYHSKQIVAIGRFVEKKAPYLTLMAYKLAKEKCPELKIKFIGDGPLLSICKDLAESLHIKDVSFTGVLNLNEIHNVITNSFCFIQHSKKAFNGDKEGTPVSILEAMASGLPIISTNHAGIPEVVIDGQNGFIVEEGDIETMAEKMIQLFNDRKLAKVFGEKGRSNIEQNHNSTDYFRKINALIIDCVNA